MAAFTLHANPPVITLPVNAASVTEDLKAAYAKLPVWASRAQPQFTGHEETVKAAGVIHTLTMPDLTVVNPGDEFDATRVGGWAAVTTWAAQLRQWRDRGDVLTAQGALAGSYVVVAFDETYDGWITIDGKSAAQRVDWKLTLEATS